MCFCSDLPIHVQKNQFQKQQINRHKGSHNALLSRARVDVTDSEHQTQNVFTVFVVKVFRRTRFVKNVI